MPEVASVSAREPASIQIPTVAVCRYGEYSVATDRPFDSVVVCVGRICESAGVARFRRTRGSSGRSLLGRRTDAALREKAEGTKSREADMVLPVIRTIDSLCLFFG